MRLESTLLDCHDHECQWGPVEQSRFAGTPHRKCQVEDCRMVSLDLEGDDLDGA